MIGKDEQKLDQLKRELDVSFTAQANQNLARPFYDTFD